jgi:peptidoglycan/xylan/chitin deacetylase (PgdA/CDA1 family)
MELPRRIRFLYHALRGETKAAILLLHRVENVNGETIGPDAEIALSPSVFEEVVRQLSTQFRPLPLPDIVHRLRSGKALPKQSVALTFDDGFRDTLTTARPILEKYDVPATCYVTSGFVDETVRPYEYVLAHYVEAVSHVQLHWEGETQTWTLGTLADRKECYRAIKTMGKPLPTSGRKRLLRSLRPRVGDSIDAARACPEYMSPEEVSELENHPLFTIGAHTHTHSLLSSLSSEEARAEIQGGLDRLQGMINAPIRHFSYPYGGCSSATSDMVKDIGFDSAVTTQPVAVNARHHSPQQLPRIEVQDLSDIDNLNQYW